MSLTRRGLLGGLLGLAAALKVGQVTALEPKAERVPWRFTKEHMLWSDAESDLSMPFLSDGHPVAGIDPTKAHEWRNTIVVYDDELGFRTAVRTDW